MVCACEEMVSSMSFILASSAPTSSVCCSTMESSWLRSDRIIASCCDGVAAGNGVSDAGAEDILAKEVMSLAEPGEGAMSERRCISGRAVGSDARSEAAFVANCLSNLRSLSPRTSESTTLRLHDRCPICCGLFLLET